MNSENADYTLGKIDPECLCKYDPLIRILLKASKNNGYRAGLIAFTLYLVFDVLLGWLISEYYMSKGYSFIYFTQPGELFTSIFVYFVAAPIAWAFYVWEPISSINVFRELDNNKVIRIRKTGYSSIDQFVQEEFKLFNRKISLFLVLLDTLIISIFGISQSFYPIKEVSWFNINEYYFWIIWIPSVFINVYIILWLVFRRSVTIRIINKLFDSFDIEPIIYHEDHANGLFPIGDYVIKVAPVITVAGFWIIIISASLHLRGLNNSFFIINSAMLLYMFIYFLATVVALIPPVMKTHRYMKARKEGELTKLGKQIGLVLIQFNKGTTSRKNEFRGNHFLNLLGVKILGRNIYKQLKGGSINHHRSEILELLYLDKKYQLIDLHQHTWPFDISSLQKYSFTIITPIITIILGVIANIVYSKLIPPK